MLKYFPTQYKPYEHQLPVLEELDKALKSKTKFIILQAPTGSGKSLFAATLSNYTNEPSQFIKDSVDNQTFFARDQFGGYQYEEDILNEQPFGSYTLTVSKQLQSQYSKLFDECDLLKGKINYQCAIDDQFTCEISPCHTSSNVKAQCLKEKKCPYANARDRVIKSKFGILNYSMFLCLPPHAKRRQILICDEASELEDEIINYHSVVIKYGELTKFYNLSINKLLLEDRHKARLWLTDLLKTVGSKLQEFDKKIKSKTSQYIDKKQYLDLIKQKKLLRLQDSLSIILENWSNTEYIIERIEDGVSFTPLYAHNLTGCIFKHADHVVLMSATIIDHKTFAKSLGITDYKYIEATSVFNPKKSPIYCPGKYMLNYANINKNLEKVAKQAVELCNQHKNEKGIIHTHSFKVTEAIQKQTKKQNRFIFREAGVNNEQLLEDHFLNDKDSVIVSPSLGFGADLIGDHGKFQIIMKLPYLPLGSKRIKLLSQKDYKWYNMKMLISLIQMAGRCTRSVTDESVTYILDGAAVGILKKNWNILPHWFRQRLM